MIKGTRKNMVMVKCDKGSPFESAIFILKPERGRGDKREDEDVIEKAYEIIRAGEAERGKR